MSGSREPLKWIPNWRNGTTSASTHWLHRASRNGLWYAAIEGVAIANDAEVFDAETMAALGRGVITEAHARGNCVIVGRGAQCMSQARKDVLHVFIYARWPERVARVRERLPAAADLENLIRSADRQRADHIRTYSGNRLSRLRQPQPDLDSRGRIRINLNWNQNTPQNPSVTASQGGGFLGKLSAKPAEAAGGIDLDIGCLFEMTNGAKSAVQALGDGWAPSTVRPTSTWKATTAPAASAAAKTSSSTAPISTRSSACWCMPSSTRACPTRQSTADKPW